MDAAALSPSRIAPVPSGPLCLVWSATQSGFLNRSSKTSSALATRSPPGMEGARKLRNVVLPAWVRTGT